VLLLYVALGSAVGGVSRFVLGSAVQARTPGLLPAGTLAVNVIGSFLVAFVLRYAADTPAISPEARALLATGFCGGFTTFSAFSYETLRLVQEGDYGRAALNVFLNLVLSLMFAVAGFVAAQAVLDLRRRI
jgi:fluoride exporter